MDHCSSNQNLNLIAERKNIMRYKNIIFDFGNVLAKFDAQQVIEKFCPAPEDFPIIKEAVFYDWDSLDKGIIDYDTYMDTAALKVPERLRPSIYRLSRDWCRLLTPIYRTWDFIYELKKRGYSIYLLSNASSYFAEQSDHYKILKEFDGIVFSGPLKMMKPELDIYKYLFAAYSLKPEECFFLDDKEENIAAGRQLGMDGLVFTENIQEVKHALGI